MKGCGHFFRNAIATLVSLSLSLSGYPVVAENNQRADSFDILAQITLPGQDRPIRRPVEGQMDRLPGRSVIPGIVNTGRPLTATEQFLLDLDEAGLRQLECRLARVAEARAEVVVGIFDSMSATPEQLDAAAANHAAMVAAACSGTNNTQAVIDRQAALLMEVGVRFAEGTLMEGRGDLLAVTVGWERLRHFEETCFANPGIPLEDLAELSETEFSNLLPQISFGACGSQAGSSSSLAGGSEVPARAFGQCISAALRNSAMKSLNECNPVSDDPDETPVSEPEDGTEGTEEEDTGEESSEGEVIVIEEPFVIEDQNTRTARGLDQIAAGAKIIVGGAIAIIGARVALAGGIVEVFTGGLGTPVAGPLIGGGLAAVAAGTGLAASGISDIAKIIRDQPRLCPALNTPMGSLTFASDIPQRPSGEGLQPGRAGLERMTVFDSIQSCACEHDPRNALEPGRGNRCQNAERNRCLREAEANDVAGRIDFRCMALLRQDNADKEARQNDECGVLQCGPDAMIGSDCRCYAMDGDPLSRQEASGRCQMQCMEGFRPAASACGCVPDDAEPTNIDLPNWLRLELQGGDIRRLPGGVELPPTGLPEILIDPPVVEVPVFPR